MCLPFAAVLQVFRPQSPQARAIFNRGTESSVILAVIFAVVARVIVYALMRFRWPEGEPGPHQGAENRTIGLVWTAIPRAIVVALFAFTARTMSCPILRRHQTFLSSDINVGKPEGIAEIAGHLASDEATYITGSAYFIDGGLLRQSGSY
jgi:magnesium-transporting ATPase (P-type)